MRYHFRSNLLVGAVGTICLLGCTPSRDITRPDALSEDIAPAWSPRGDSIAFVHLKTNSEDVHSDGVYLVHPSGGVKRLLYTGFVRSVDWSPDGRYIIFNSLDGLVACTSNGDSVRVLHTGPAYFPSWSPDGEWIAFDDVERVWIIPSTGGDPMPITYGRDPDWAPDGQSLVIRRGFEGAFGGELALITLSGEVRRRLTMDANEDRSPAWSPLGVQIAWNRWLRNGQGQIRPEFWVIDTTGSNPRLLLTGEGDPSWSPNATELVVSRSTGSGSRLFRISATGGPATQITF